jgi:acyl carrier protein
MELEQLINKNPQLNKITEKLINQISIEKYSINLDYNKTLGDNGFDDLDCIEMVMEIEKRLDIVISDDIVDFLFNVGEKPPRFREYWRNKKLEDLGL